jgi:hypothetical protein
MTIAVRIILSSFLFAIALASVLAHAQQPAGTIQITHGGTYSGNWMSTNPSIAAVTVRTSEPVTIKNSVLSGRGDLIQFSGGNLRVENVTGKGLDPGVKGMTRGAFLAATSFNSLVVKNCTMDGVAFGVKVTGGTPQTLQIVNNKASNLEDRASDDAGGLLPVRPKLGHFILLNHVVAQNGAEIAWNQVVQTMGKSSTEDVVNIYESQGSKAHPIDVSHNYIEGASSAIPGKNYTGTALITDGDASANATPTAYVLFEDNLIVETSGSGIGIAFGHDITARENRVVSCGVDSSGNRYAWGASAAVIWNYYKSKQFYNNTITGTTGGMVGPAPNRQFKTSNELQNKTDNNDPSNSITDSNFTNPCLSSGTPNPKAEDAERARWAAEVAAAHELIGDQHH